MGNSWAALAAWLADRNSSILVDERGQDDRDLTSREDGRDLDSGITQYLKRPNQVMWATLLGMRPPSHNLTIAVIDHPVAGLRQKRGKPGCPQRPRRLLLTGPMGCQTRRNAEQT